MPETRIVTDTAEKSSICNDILWDKDNPCLLMAKYIATE